MSFRNRTVALTSLCLATLAATASGETSQRTYVDDAGVTWQETKTVTQQMVPTTEYQTRQEQVYTPQTSTTYQAYQQNYLTPVTEYRWVSRRRGILNPFIQPYWTHQLEPHTRWENRPTTVQVPVTSTQWVAGTRTVSSPVVTYKAVPQETTHKVALNTPASTTLGTQPATAIASRPTTIGGTQMTGDPPRSPTRWVSPTTPGRYR
ncbi:hypothetical protein [Aeoliella sp.]|uniref:hypothetical protein n=1 Tax=Aeoliella sp. TaxID=2795800 RepID=UPI003CCBB56F